MSTFDGRIRQYPTIYIDNYAAKQDTRIFLLSHCHADHLSGLKSPNFDVPLYCSKETAYLLLRLPHKRRATNAQEEQPKYLHLAKYLRPLEYEEPLQVYIGNGQTVTLTLFPANHCVGSTMFLIEGPNGNVLYTGDLRAEAWFTQGIQEYLDRDIIPRDLACVYLDTTFCSTDFFAFPSKRESIESVIHIIRGYRDDMLFHIGYNIFGVETLWEAIAQEFQTKIYLSPLRFAVYSALQPCPPYITNDPTSTRFHACQKCDICPPARSSGEIVHIRLSTMGWRDELRTAGTGIDARQFPLKQLGERYWHVLYSIHSSFEELSDLVTVLRPREVFPCVLSADRLDSKRVKDLFTQFLRPPSPEHTRATAILDVEELLESSQGTDVVDEEGIYAVKAEDVKGEDMKSADIKDEDGKARDPSGELEPRYMRRERSIDSVENELQAASAVSSLSLQDAPVPCPHPIETTHSNDHHDANLTSIPDHPHFSDDDFIEIESDTTSESIDFGVVHDHSDSDPDPGIMSQHRQSDIPKTSQRVNRSFDQHPSPASTVRSVRTLSPVAVVDDVIPVSIRSPLQRRATWVPDAVQTFEKPRLVKSTTNVRLADRAPRRLPSHWTLPEVIDLTED